MGHLGVCVWILEREREREWKRESTNQPKEQIKTEKKIVSFILDHQQHQ